MTIALITLEHLLHACTPAHVFDEALCLLDLTVLVGKAGAEC